MQNLYYRDERQIEYGPASRKQLQELLWAKEISDLGEVRRDGSSEWRPILSVLREPVPPPLPRLEQKLPVHTLGSKIVGSIRKRPSLSAAVLGVAAAAAIGAAVVILSLVNSQPPKGNQPAAHAGTRQADGSFLILECSPGFVSKEDLTLSVKLAKEDKTSFNEFLAARLNSGSATLFNVGESVRLEDSAWPGWVKLRCHGKATSYWTIPGAIGE